MLTSTSHKNYNKGAKAQTLENQGPRGKYLENEEPVEGSCHGSYEKIVPKESQKKRLRPNYGSRFFKKDNRIKIFKRLKTLKFSLNSPSIQVPFRKLLYRNLSVLERLKIKKKLILGIWAQFRVEKKMLS